MVTSLARPFVDSRRRKKGLYGRGLLKGRKGKSSERRERCWNFSDVLWVKDVLSIPPLEGSRDFCPVEYLYPHFLVVVLTHLC